MRTRKEIEGDYRSVPHEIRDCVFILEVVLDIRDLLSRAKTPEEAQNRNNP